MIFTMVPTFVDHLNHDSLVQVVTQIGLIKRQVIVEYHTYN